MCGLESVLILGVKVDLSERVVDEFSVLGDAVGSLDPLSGIISPTLALLSVRGLFGVDSLDVGFNDEVANRDPRDVRLPEFDAA